MNGAKRVLVFHTAFIGDIILMLPMVQALRSCAPDAFIAVVAVPLSAEVLAHHPAVNEIIRYDKKGRDRGVAGFLRLVRKLRGGNFDLALVPHRSLRSALACWLARIPQRIGFDRSAGRMLFTSLVTYDPGSHEIDRNLHLLRAVEGCHAEFQLPRVYPSPGQISRVDGWMEAWDNSRLEANQAHLVAIAPGSVWFTKRWPEDQYLSLVRALTAEGLLVVFIGGRDDAALCSSLVTAAASDRVRSAAGELSLLESAELIRRCAVLVTNDSAPLHLAVAVHTPVVAIFGPTVPAFGFGPRDAHDTVVEIIDLACRPCSIHGGNSCPITTFECMKRILPDDVLTCVRLALLRISREP